MIAGNLQEPPTRLFLLCNLLDVHTIQEVAPFVPEGGKYIIERTHGFSVGQTAGQGDFHQLVAKHLLAILLC